MDEVLTPEEIAKEWKIELRNVRDWCRTGKLKAYKLERQWRVKRVDWEAFINRGGEQTKKASGLALAC